MKKIFTLLLFLPFLAAPLRAQTYGNEWIHYNQTYYKIKIPADGLYRIRQSTLAANIPVLSSLSGANFMLFNKGQEVPIYVSTNNTSDTTLYIEFYGQHNDGWFDSTLYQNHSWQMNDAMSLLTDTAAYFLTYDNTSNHLRFTNLSNNISNPPAPENYCWSTSQLIFGATRSNNDYSPGMAYLVVLGSFDGIYGSEFGNAEGYGSPYYNYAAASFPMNTPHCYQSGPAASATAQYLGTFPTDHNVEIGIGTQTFVTEHFTGYATHRVSFQIPNLSLLSGATTNEFVSTANSNALYADVIKVANLKIKYPRQFNFDNQSEVLFALNAAAGNQYIEVTNFNENNAQPVLYDLTSRVRIMGTSWSSGNDIDKFLLPPSATEHQVVVAANNLSTIHEVTTMKKRVFTNYTQASNQADFIILTHPKLFDDGTGHNYINDFKQMKIQQGYSTVIADVTDIYDQFGYGIDLHPLGIRNFTHYAKSHWNAEYLFIIGKGIEYANGEGWGGFNNDVSSRPSCLVPTWGWPGSDNLLSATDTSDLPLLATGRIPALNTDDVKAYLDKEHDFVAIQSDTSALSQNNESKLWMKNIMDVAGGYDAGQQSQFQYFLNQDAAYSRDTFFGAKVYDFFKNSSDPVQIPTGNQMRNLLDSGICLLNFFGHSAASTFDYQITPVADMNNLYGRYPMFISNGCLVGDIFQNGRQLADDYILTANKGVIGFLASDYFGVDLSLSNYSQHFFKHFSRMDYTKPIGHIVQNNLADVYSQGHNDVDRIVFQQILLDMDPSLHLMTYPRPDYNIQSNTVYTVPSTLSAGIDSFNLVVVITNLGKAINDSFNVNITRHLPGGAYQYFLKRIKAPLRIDTVTFRMKVDALTDLGPNSFQVQIDLPSEIPEIEDIANNELTFTKVIQSNDIIPVWPYEFSIVSQQGVILKGSTVNPLEHPQHYLFQIDTTENFNSPLFRETGNGGILHSGGVVSWAPGITLQDSMVYYWRVCVDSAIANHVHNWHTSSFIYLPGSSPGWNQSHFYQIQKDNLTNLQLLHHKKLEFDADIKTISFHSANRNYLVIPDDAMTNIFLNGQRYTRWAYFSDPATVYLIIDSATGTPFEDPWYGPYKGKFGTWNEPSQGEIYGFQYKSAYTNTYDSLMSMVQWLPHGWYLAGVTAYNWKPASFTNHVTYAGMTMQQGFNTLGLNQINTARSTSVYCFLAKKGDPSFAKEYVQTDSTKVLDTAFQFVSHWNQGNLTSTLIGPAASWTSFHYRYHELEPGNDHWAMMIYGVDTAGNSTLLVSNVHALDTLISGISATQYPYLKLKLTMLDTVTRTPLQLDYWRINYQPVPELALDASSWIETVQHDTISQFLPYVTGIAVNNVSDYPFSDSLTMKYQFTDAHNVSHLYLKNNKPVPAHDTIHAELRLATNQMNGLNQSLTEANPFGSLHHPEQAHFNNYLIKNVQVLRDNLNPLLDVTFDGIHILNGDIVSAKPEILVKLKDDNHLVALDDTNNIQMQLIYPDGSTHPIHYNGTTAVFIPANSSQLAKLNEAQVYFNPVLSIDGTYRLIVQGYDRSGNAAGNYNYESDFEVINKAMVSNVLNYPNPFTSQTHFVFTLTGSSLPSFMKIQIMTITGKVVKEIFMSDLGPLHIGRNITDYTWDGTDQYGDPLANGVYLYRVITREDGKQLDEYNTNTDKYFKEGIGKMVLAR